jgi:hypothetical protein
MKVQPVLDPQHDGFTLEFVKQADLAGLRAPCILIARSDQSQCVAQLYAMEPSKARITHGNFGNAHGGSSWRKSKVLNQLADKWFGGDPFLKISHVDETKLDQLFLNIYDRTVERWLQNQIPEDPLKRVNPATAPLTQPAETVKPFDPFDL